MKKILLSMLTLTIAFSSMAQDSKSTGKKEFKSERKEFKKDGGFKSLNLTDAQKSQMKTINEDFKTQMKSVHEANGDIKAKREALVKEHQQKIEAILTPEQKTKMAEFKQQHSQQSGGYHRGGTSHKGAAHRGRFDQLTKDLDLTPEQTTKVNSLNESLKANVQSIQKNDALTQDQKKEQVKSLMQKHRQDLQSMLTKEQKEKLKIRMKNQPNHKSSVK